MIANGHMGDTIFPKWPEFDRSIPAPGNKLHHCGAISDCCKRTHMVAMAFKNVSQITCNTAREWPTSHRWQYLSENPKLSESHLLLLK